jgi:hypothetical protein
MELIGPDTRWTPPQQRFMRRVSLGHSGGCWKWTGHVNPNGYASFDVGGRTVGAHVFAYEWFVGPLNGREPDHLCRVEDCVNPDHLEAVTHRENVRRGTGPVSVNMALIACRRGHPFDEANTYLHDGRRCCRECRREAVRAFRTRKAA